MIREELRRWFPDAFLVVLDSCTTADLVCCDSCYRECRAIWPLARNSIEEGAIPINWFYSATKLCEEFTEEEYYEFLKDVPCPRCGGPQEFYLYPYSPPFELNPCLEREIKEVAEIAIATPFLVLSHPFSRRVFEMLQSVGETVQSTTFSQYLYRARNAEDVIFRQASEFDRAPPECTSDNRYNHAGRAVLYLASDAETCFEENRRRTSVVAEIEVHFPLKVLDLVAPDVAHPEDGELLSALAYSALLSAKQDATTANRQEYMFSRFVADCARFSGIDAIKYPSTRITGTNYNLAIIRPDTSLTWIGTIRRFIDMPCDG